MARTKNVGVKSVIKKSIRKNKNPNPNLSTEDYKKIKSVQQKYEKPIRRPKTELDKIKKELSHLRNPLYRLNSKLKRETSKTKADKIRKDIRRYNKSVDDSIDTLINKRKDVKYIGKKFESIRKEKVVKRSKLKKLEKQIEEAYVSKNWKEVDRLTAHIVLENRNIDDLNEMLGMPILRLDIEKEEAPEIIGFSQDASNPLTVWEAMEVFREDRKSGEWDTFIIDGEEIASTNIGVLVMVASSFWITMQKGKTKTPLVDRYYNIEKRIVKYEAHKY